MTIDNVLEILEKHKLRIPSNVFYELKADIVNFEEPTTKNDLGVDCISREAVERIINKWLSHSDYELKDHIYSMTEKIHNLPSIIPQPRKGHWIEERNDYGEIIHWHCSNCYDDSGFITTCKWDFCPNCGSDNRKVEE